MFWKLEILSMLCCMHAKWKLPLKHPQMLHSEGALQRLLLLKSHCLLVYSSFFSASAIITRHAGVEPLPCNHVNGW